MSAERFLLWVPSLAVASFIAMVTARTVYLHQQRVRVFVRDNDELPKERLLRRTGGHLFWIWALLSAIYAWNPSPAWLPAIFSYRLIDSTVLPWVGAALVVTSVVLYPVALTNMGHSWRVGIDRDAHTSEANPRRPPATLIKHGLFRYSRNPIYTMVDGLFIGTFLVHGQLIIFLFAIAFIVQLHLQVLREEAFLAERYGDAYAAYCQRTSRYLPYV